ncbi:MAG: hypothetical protein RL757_2143 [Bacteroidota bacterium]|jgi:iron complex outermembrane receptor protein
MKIKVNFKAALLVLFAMAISNIALAQRTLKGKVTGDGESLVGASVIVTGTTKGTLTDVDGNYVLEVPADAKTLSFSFTGFATQIIPLGSSNEINVELKGGSILETAVVVGYATLKQKEVTSAIASVKAEDFNKGNINDAVSLLQGKVAGLSISRPSGDPNENAVIRLRGISTIGSNASPLVVVDGIPGVDLNLIDPNDIDQIDVLKDGSAAAIYGARASSGVLLVTTKRGSAGAPKVSYNYQASFSSISRKPALMSSQEWIDANLAAGNARVDFDKGSTTDWYKEITHPVAVSHIHNVALSGGYDKTSYYASFNIRNPQGIALKSGYNQISARFNVTQKALNDKLTLSLATVAGQREAEYGFSEAFRYATLYNPTAPVKGGSNAAANDGYNQIGGFDNFNPRAIIDQNTNNGNQKAFYFQTRADYEIITGLTASFGFANQRVNSLRGEYYSRKSLFRGNGRNGLAIRQTNEANDAIYTATLGYKKDFGKLTMNVLAGHEYQKTSYTGIYVEAGGFASDLPSYNSLQSSTELLLSNRLSIASYAETRKLSGFFGRAIFSYDDIYALTASVRREGSSMFSASNRWGVFPSVSGSVALHKLLNIASVDQLKLRTGYGVTGSLPVGSYLSQFTYDVENTGTAAASRNNNPNIKWEEKGEFNLGLDYVVLDGRLSGNLDYYNRNITDLLYYFVNLPAGLFPTTQGLWANGGALTSRGVEFSANYDVFKKKAGQFFWRTGVNLGTFSVNLKSLETAELQASAKNEVLLSNVGAPGLNGIPIVLVQANKPLGQIYTFRNAGVDAASGQPLVYTNEDKIVKIADASIEKDKVVAGNGIPKLMLGWNNRFEYKNFDLEFFFEGMFGHSLVNEYRLFYENTDGLNGQNRIKTDEWDPKLKAASFNSKYVEKADYFRLNNFTLGYNFKMPQGAQVSNMRLYVSGNNIFTITGYKGIAPDVRWTDPGSSDNGGRPGAQDPLVQGVDRRSYYFATRSFNVGLSLGF